MCASPEHVAQHVEIQAEPEHNHGDGDFCRDGANCDSCFDDRPNTASCTCWRAVDPDGRARPVCEWSAWRSHDNAESQLSLPDSSQELVASKRGAALCGLEYHSVDTVVKAVK